MCSHRTPRSRDLVLDVDPGCRDHGGAGPRRAAGMPRRQLQPLDISGHSTRQPGKATQRSDVRCGQPPHHRTPAAGTVVKARVSVNCCQLVSSVETSPR